MLPAVVVAAVAAVHAAGGVCAGVPVGAIGVAPWPLLAGQPVTVCLTPLPGPEPRSFAWDLGSDGSVDATTPQPELHLAAAPPGSLKLTVRYPNTLGVPGFPLEFPVQAAPAPAPAPGPAPVTPATVRVENDTLVYQGSPDARDYITFHDFEPPAQWRFLGAAVQPGQGCERHTSPVVFVSCPATHNADIHLGDHSRNVCQCATQSHWEFAAVTVTGGAGNDVISASGAAAVADGGPGNDVVTSSGDALGGPGDDQVLSLNGRAIGGDGDDRITGSSPLIDAGPGNDVVTTRTTRRMTVRLGAGDDRYDGRGSSAPVRVYGGAGNDRFRDHGCLCGLFGEVGNDSFQIATSNYVGTRWRGQFALGGPGRDTGLLDGIDCARGVERITITRRSRDDRRYHCRTPGTRLRPQRSASHARPPLVPEAPPRRRGDRSRLPSR